MHGGHTSEERRLATAARSPELSALLADLDNVRLLLATDLELAAAALDAGAPDLAAEAVAADRELLAAFEQRAVHHLAAPAAGTRAAEAVVGDRTARPRRRPLGSRRLRRMLPAAPALAAAALVAVLAGLVPTGSSPARDSVAAATAATTSYTELARLARGGAELDAVRSAARDLHSDVAQLLPLAASNASAAHEALVLLELEKAVLAASEHRAHLEPEIAESQRLSGLLQEALTTPSGRAGGLLPVPGPAGDVADGVASLLTPPTAAGGVSPGAPATAGTAPAGPPPAQPRAVRTTPADPTGAGSATLLEQVLRPAEPLLPPPPVP